MKKDIYCSICGSEPTPDVPIPTCPNCEHTTFVGAGGVVVEDVSEDEYGRICVTGTIAGKTDVAFSPTFEGALNQLKEVEPVVKTWELSEGESVWEKNKKVTEKVKDWFIGFETYRQDQQQKEWRDKIPWDERGNWDSQKYKLFFKEPVTIRAGRRLIKNVTAQDVYLFKSTTGHLCFAPYRKRVSTGWHFIDLPLEHLEKVEWVAPLPLEERKAARAKELASIAKKIHPNIWEDFKEQLLERPEEISGDVNSRPIASIKKVFGGGIVGQQVVDALQEALDNKTPYRHSRPALSGRGRDKSVSVEVRDDGRVQAFYSSEYPGCGNGDYYLLLNAKQAVFYETD